MNRGSPEGEQRPRWVGTGFNEAPIHESGKSCSAGLRDLAPPRLQ